MILYNRKRLFRIIACSFIIFSAFCICYAAQDNGLGGDTQTDTWLSGDTIPPDNTRVDSAAYDKNDISTLARSIENNPTLNYILMAASFAAVIIFAYLLTKGSTPKKKR